MSYQYKFHQLHDFCVAIICQGPRLDDSRQPAASTEDGYLPMVAAGALALGSLMLLPTIHLGNSAWDRFLIQPESNKGLGPLLIWAMYFYQFQFPVSRYYQNLLTSWCSSTSHQIPGIHHVIMNAAWRFGEASNVAQGLLDTRNLQWQQPPIPKIVIVKCGFHHGATGTNGYPKWNTKRRMMTMIS